MNIRLGTESTSPRLPTNVVQISFGGEEQSSDGGTSRAVRHTLVHTLGGRVDRVDSFDRSNGECVGTCRMLASPLRSMKEARHTCPHEFPVLLMQVLDDQVTVTGRHHMHGLQRRNLVKEGAREAPEWV